MLENVTSGRDSGYPEWLTWLQPGTRSAQFSIVLLVLAISTFGVRARVVRPALRDAVPGTADDPEHRRTKPG